MADIKNLQAVVAALAKKAAQATKDNNVQVAVGYTASYAIYVHENLQAQHPVGQAKFLETPARLYAEEIAEIVMTGLRKGLSMAKSLLMGGLKLQRDSQKLVPVDTGALKNSAFTRLEKGTE